MPYITDINADGDLNAALANFSAVCAANSVVLGLSPADLTEISGAATTFNTNLNTWTAARATATSAKTTKDTQKTTSKTIVSKWAKVFRAKTTVSDALLAQLMLPPHKVTAVSTPPTIPTDVVATANGNGDIRISWNRNGNRNGTTFLIEYRASSGDAWAVLSSTTKSKFDTQWQPGSYVAFRVIAQRGGMTSAASTPVVLWDGSGPVQLQLAA